MSNINDNCDPDKRLSLDELRKIEKYSNVGDEEGEAIINDTIALARMILDLMN